MINLPRSAFRFSKQSKKSTRADLRGAGPRPSAVLYVSGTPLVPSKLGPARRNHHIVDQLSRFYDVSVLAYGTRADAEIFKLAFADRISRVEFVPIKRPRLSKCLYKVWRTATGRCDFVPSAEPAFRRACVGAASREPFDAIVLSSVLLRSLPLPASTPIVADTHNVEFDVLRRTSSAADDVFHRCYARCQSVFTAREERRCGHRVALLMATSERDQTMFQEQLQIPEVAVVPNGIDVEEFSPRGDAPQDTPVILFTGLMSYYPNQQGVRWFLRNVFPAVLKRVPSARLVIAGAGPPQWLMDQRRLHVEVTGRVPDMRPYLAGASVVIAPLMIGGGTRVKILEALAMARPVVSTTIGAEGLALENGESILIGDDPDTFASHVVRALTDRVAAKSLADHGRQRVLAHFDWDRIGGNLERLLRSRIGLVARETTVPQRAAVGPC